MRAHLIVNPESGTNRAMPMLPRITGRLGALFESVDVTVTARAGDAENGARQAIDEGCAALYVAGGDGTLNAVVHAMHDRPGRRHPPIGIIPLGTGNEIGRASCRERVYSDV